jgi:nucleotidyltransferase/DNA polymerase involved in DNA repair
VGPLYACVYRLPRLDDGGAASLTTIAEQFSPRYERHADDLLSIDVSGLERLLGTPRTIGEELRREAADRGLRVHVAVARRRMAALLLAVARPGLTVVGNGEEAAALAPVRLGVLEKFAEPQNALNTQSDKKDGSVNSAISAVKHWGIQTLGELAALPAAQVRARLGHDGLIWHAMARGEDIRPLVPAQPEERFDGTMDLEWPIAELEPLSFVLTRLLEPLSTRLERRDRGAAVLHVHLRLVTKEVHARRLELPTPMRDVRTLRTLALLDLESHPAPAPIDRVTIAIDPTPGRILQHTLFTRPVPTAEQISTLLARLHALMGQERVGAAATVDSYRPGAFAMRPFATDHEAGGGRSGSADRGDSAARLPQRAGETPPSSKEISASFAVSALPRVAGALRRCRQPVPARVALDRGDRPVRVTSDRRGFAGGTVAFCTGPWRTSGDWWVGEGPPAPVRRTTRAAARPSQSAAASRGAAAGWNRDEWDVTLGDGTRYRIFRDRVSDAWFIDSIVD